MLSPELIKQIKHIQLRAGRRATDALTGEYASVFKGQGMEFDEVREYVPGDDVRAIDWNVTARMQQPFVKVFREEREQTVQLLVDVSRSQAFATAERSKLYVASELAAILAYTAIRSQDRVGLMTFSDHIETHIPASKGRGHVWRIIREVLAHTGGDHDEDDIQVDAGGKRSGMTTDIAGALDELVRVQKRSALCFLISDFWAPDYERALRFAAKRLELVCVTISDAFEHTLPDVGMMRLRDRESGRQVWVDTSDRAFRQNYETHSRRHYQELVNQFRKAGVDHVALSTEDSIADVFMAYLRRKDRARGRHV